MEIKAWISESYSKSKKKLHMLSRQCNQRHYCAYHIELLKLKHGTGTKATTQQNEFI